MACVRRVLFRRLIGEEHPAHGLFEVGIRAGLGRGDRAPAGRVEWGEEGDAARRVGVGRVGEGDAGRIGEERPGNSRPQDAFDVAGAPGRRYGVGGGEQAERVGDE